MTPSPSLSPLASLLLSLAHWVAPKDDKVWIGDMRLEAVFVPNKLQFALSALGLALRFRWGVLKHRPATLAFASMAVAAVATLLFVPRMLNNPPTANGAMSPVTNSDSYEATSEYLQDAAAERGVTADAQAAQPEEAVTEAAVPQTLETAAQANTTPAAEAAAGDAAAEVPATPQEPLAPADQVQTQLGNDAGAEVPAVPNPPEALEVVPPSAAITSSEPTTAESTTDTVATTLSQEPTAAMPAPTEQGGDTPVAAESEAPTDTTSESSTATVGEAASSSSNQATTPSTSSAASELDETSTHARLAPIPAPLTPSADTIVLSTQVRGDSVTLESTGTALLTIYRNSDFAGSPRIHRYLEAGETLIFGIPFSLYTDDASAITVTVDGSSFALSRDSQEQFRVFTKP
jgi:hypothetical protein